MRYSEDIEKLVDSAGYIYFIFQNRVIRKDQIPFIEDLLNKLENLNPEIQNRKEVIYAKQDLSKILN